MHRGFPRAVRAALSLAVSFLCLPCAGYTFPATPYNHAHIQWYTSVTPHFLIHYYEKTEPACIPVATIAEDAFTSLTRIYDYPAGRKINIVLADHDDMSNGLAMWAQNTIVIWLPDADFDLRGNNIWLENVVTHELAHIITLQKDAPATVMSFTTGVSLTSRLDTISANWHHPTTTFYPVWFGEGLAQLESTRRGYDTWDTRRDMVLRRAVLDNTLLSLGEMGNFNHDAHGNERVYNQGFAFTRYIRQRWGNALLNDMVSQTRSVAPLPSTVYGLFEQETGISIHEAYRQWTRRLDTIYTETAPDDTTVERAVWTKGDFNTAPRVHAHAGVRGWLTSHRSDARRTDLVIARTTESEPFLRIPYVKGSWDFSADGSTVYYITSRAPDAHGSFFNDLFARDISTGRTTRLTRGARVYDVTASPDGTFLLCVRYREGAYTVETFALDARTFTPLFDGIIGRPFRAPRFFPGSSDSFAITRIDYGNANIYTGTISQTYLSPLCATSAQESAPVCAPDGRVFFSCDRGGIHNIWSVRPGSSEYTRHSRTRGGLFTPALLDTHTILCSSYRSGGFVIATFTPSVLQQTTAGTAPIRYSPYDSSAADILTSTGLVYGTFPTMSKPMTQAAIKFGLVDTAPHIQLSAPFAGTSYGLGFSALATVSDALNKTTHTMHLGLVVIPIEIPDAEFELSSHPADNDVHTRIRRLHARIPAGRCAAPATDDMAEADARASAGLPSGILTTHYMKETIASQRAGLAQQQNDAADSTAITLPIPFVHADYSLVWRGMYPTTRLGVSSMLLLGFLPYEASLYGTMQWPIGRSAYCGAGATVHMTPGGVAGAQIPLSFAWQDAGYMSRHLSFHRRSLSSFSFSLMPFVIPQLFIIGSGPSADTSVVITSGTQWNVRGAHGFGILSSSCLHAHTSHQLWSFSERTELPWQRNIALNQQVPTYIHSTATLSLLHPLVKRINAGTRYYGDALYAKVFYESSVYGAGNGIRFDTLFHRLGSFTRDTGSMYVEHLVGAGVDFGMYKSYAFNLRSGAALAYDIWRKDMRFTLKLHF